MALRIPAVLRARPSASLAPGLAWSLDTLLHSYSQVLFTQNRKAGLVLLLATAVEPLWFAFGLGSVILCTAIAALLGMDKSQIRQGAFGYNGLLTGLAFPVFLSPSPSVLALWCLSMLAVVILTAALTSLLGYTFNLPVLSLPFILTLYIALSTASLWSGTILYSTPALGHAPEDATEHFLSLAAFLKSLGAIFFLPTPETGALVCLALVVASRIGLLLSVTGFLAALSLTSLLLLFPQEPIYHLVGFNFILTAIAIGGVWFVPGWHSFLAAFAACLLCAAFTAGLLGLFQPLGLPVLILPFNLTVILFLLAMRRRESNAPPIAVDLPGTSPEENLARHLTQRERGASPLPVPIRLPFSGAWICTQAENGFHTHQGPWRHAWDFEIENDLGRNFQGAGRRPDDYYCFHQPVLAPAGGWVARVVDGIPDNAVGESNRRHPWGNCVILGHGSGLFSALCHLSPNTVRVQQGQSVQQGEVLGLCGNSGRSPVPHLHFQLQRSPEVGAPTRAGPFSDFVTERRHYLEYVPLGRPRLSQVVRNVTHDIDLFHLFKMPSGPTMHFHLNNGNSDALPPEDLLIETDINGNLALSSRSNHASLSIHLDGHVLTPIHFRGNQRSVLWGLFLAMPRLPAEISNGLEFSDTVPRKALSSLPRKILLDLMSPFWKTRTLVPFRYTLLRSGNTFTVNGRARAFMPELTTSLSVDTTTGIREILIKKDRSVLLHAVRQESGGEHAH